MERLLRILACLIAGAVILAAQCSSACFVSANMPGQVNGKCHHSPDKTNPECPLKHCQLSKAEPSVDIGFHAVTWAAAPPQVAMLVRLPLHLSFNLPLDQGEPPGPPLRLLFSTLRI
jgi:hypothetical protein